jgi:hypothetical protein
MDQFRFSKIFNYCIVANLKYKANSSSQPYLRGHETEIFSKTDEKHSDHAQEGKSEFNPGLQNFVKKQGGKS